MGIKQDRADLEDILRQRVKDGVKRRIEQGQMLGKVGDKTVTIPFPDVRLPRFSLDPNKQYGTGQGEGDEGDALPGQGPMQPGQGDAGENEGEHLLAVDWDKQEIRDWLGEDLGLPRIQPKGTGNIGERRVRYTGIKRQGPPGLSVYRRGHKRALRRLAQDPTWTPGDPVVLVPDDKRYRAPKVEIIPKDQAAIYYMMDVSGSMGFEQKEMARIEAYYLDLWLSGQYDALETVHIIHDAKAQEVDADLFFRIRESGGTKISSAYELALELIHLRHPPSEWNVYVFHWTDGDNWGGGDTDRCISMLYDHFMQDCNQFASIQVKSAYGSGDFNKTLRKVFDTEEDDDTEVYYRDALALSFLHSRDDIRGSIQGLLKRGR